MNGTGPSELSAQRLDRWLWFARFFKSRTLAASLVTGGKVRVNGERVTRASRSVRPGDVLTFPTGPHIRVIKILAPGTRRGPAPEARLLYEDQDPPAATAATPQKPSGPAAREPGSGRPTKKEQRQMAAFKKQSN